MKLTQVMNAIVIAGAIGISSIAQADKGFDGALNDAKKDLKRAERALKNSTQSTDLAKLEQRLDRVQQLLADTQQALADVQKGLASAKFDNAKAGDGMVAAKAFMVPRPAVRPPVRPSPVASPTPPQNSPRIPLPPMEMGF